MIEIAEAINNLARVVDNFAVSIFIMGLLFLFFKNMGGN